ncbi:MAG TPA: type I DNA topoisomerase [Candidatus Peribacteraceae bacterium]|nr:type I DNA topoisomerase [Candidatus Peribacteraceae bacterium]
MPKHLVIVESPAKAKTIKRFLGKDYLVEASMGHVRDLPHSGIGVDVEHGFEPTYEVSEGKESVVKKLRAALKEADDLWIATDEDREGEAIGWHLTQALKVKEPEKVKRIVFHEITEPAIKAAVEHPRTLDMKLVDAQQARRILDRLVGYTLSPFLWKKVYSGLSAGRVQSVAVRIIVDREREIRAFNPVEYWSIEAELLNDKKQAFSAFLDKKDGKKLELHNKEETDAVLSAVHGKPFTVSNVEEKEVSRNPAAPFTTSTLQQEAARKLGFSVKQTMVVAQQLYEGVSLGKGEGQAGLITYMRTDSVNLSEKALTDAKRVIEQQFGREYVLSSPRTYKTKAKGAQEAHEAIRPTEMERTPESLAAVLDHQQLKLYTLIWNRTVATQMPAAEFKRIAADISVDAYSFRATGQTVIFDGFLRVYSEGKDEDVSDQRSEVSEQDADGEKFLPPLAVGESLDCEELKPEQHFTKPPPRYTEASLVKKMEEEGIGRPSTYAPTISTIQQRGYIRKEGRNLFPEDIAFTVTDLLAEHFPDIVDLAFTAGMEQSLDDIAEGTNEGMQFLKNFYTPFKNRVDSKTKEIKKEDVLKERVVGIDPETKLEVIVRTGRFGPYVQLGRLEVEKGAKKKKGEGPKTASLPKTISIDDVTMEQAMSLLAFPRVLGKHDGNDMQVILGRFGPYLKCGDVTTALPADVDPGTVNLTQAVELLTTAAERKKKAAEPLKTLGKDPESGNDIHVKDGRFGPYVTDGKTNASLTKKFTVESITLADAAELLQKKRTSPKKAWRGKKK